LFKDIFQSTGRYFQKGLACNSDRSGFDRVAKLAMTAFHSRLFPSVILKALNDVPNFHSVYPLVLLSANDNPPIDFSIDETVEVDALLLKAM